MPDGTLYEVWVCSACMAPVHFREESGYEWPEWVGHRTCDEGCWRQGRPVDDDDGVRRVLIETDAPLRVT